MEIKDRVKKLREKMRITQDDLARTLGVKPLTVSRWERGVNKPSGVVADRIAALERRLNGNPAS